jgi:hypothetical protein
MLIKLSDGCWINQDDILEVTILESSQSVIVRTKNGIGHSLFPSQGQGLYAFLDELILQINGEK